MQTLKAILDEPHGFRRRLLRWYERNRRALPWRETREPYPVWVSEIMLQQTRVNAVLGHYRRFLERFPDVHALSVASEAGVLAAWSGLGYYRRARMMHAAAKKVAAELGGDFPATYEALRGLPGIGRYTAAAIASIAGNEPQAVVDGNVERVVSRLAGRAVPTRQVWDFADGVLDGRRPGEFNQAMMELGALVCTPVGPRCGACPVRRYCKAQGELSARAQTPRRQKIVGYVFARERGRVRLVQREAKARLMAGMWELPEVEPNGVKPLLEVRHSITTTDYRVKVYAGTSGTGEWIPLRRLASMPLTGLTRKVLMRLGAIARPA